MDQQELSSKTVAQLKVMAAEMGLDVPVDALKANIVDIILKAMEAKSLGQPGQSVEEIPSASPINLDQPAQDTGEAPPTPPNDPADSAATADDPVSETESPRSFLFRPRSGQPFTPMGVPAKGLVAEEGSTYENFVGVFLEKLNLDGTPIKG
jgi:hypothetical protein